MGSPYTGVTVQNYNADAPPDDGTRVSANQLTWAKHKTKIGDPLKVAIEAINANVQTAFGKMFGNNVQAVAADYAVTTANQGQALSVTGTRTITLLTVATAGPNFTHSVLNAGSGVVTLDGAGAELVNGVAAVYLGPGESAVLSCDGTSWTALIATLLPNRVQTKPGNHTLLASDNRSLLDFTATATLTLLAAATAGNQFRLLLLNSGTGLLTLDGDAAETINGAATYGVPPGGNVLLTCDGTSAWTASVLGARDQRRWKTADETVSNNAALQDDDHLAGFQIEPDATYEVLGFLALTASTVSDLKIAFDFTQLPQSFFVQADGGTTGTPGGAITYVVSASGDFVNRVFGYIRGHATLPATMKLQWAQATPEVFDTKVRLGSWLELRKVSP